LSKEDGDSAAATATDGSTSRPNTNHNRRRSFEFENLVRNGAGTTDSSGGFLEEWGKYAAYVKITVSGLVYLTGVVCLLTYASLVSEKSPTLGFAHTVMPTLLHLIGIGATVMLKVEEVGKQSSHHAFDCCHCYFFNILAATLWLLLAAAAAVAAAAAAHSRELLLLGYRLSLLNRFTTTSAQQWGTWKRCTSSSGR
jgi:hypothetical protein